MAEEKKTVSIELPPGVTAKDLEKLLSKTTKEAKESEHKGEGVIFKSLESGDQELRVSQDWYKGRSLLSIRKWYTDKDSEELKPGKGVTINYEDIDLVIEGLQKMKEWCEENPEVE